MMTKGKASPYVWCEHCQRRVLAIYHQCKIDRPPERSQVTKIPPVDTGVGYVKPKPKRKAQDLPGD